MPQDRVPKDVEHVVPVVGEGERVDQSVVFDDKEEWGDREEEEEEEGFEGWRGGGGGVLLLGAAWKEGEDGSGEEVEERESGW